MCGGGGRDTLPTEGDTAIAAFNYSVASYIHQCRNNGLHQRGDEGAHHRPYINIYIYIHATTTNVDHHHTVQVAQAQVEYVRQWVEGRPPVQVATGDTTTGAKTVCANG